VTPEAVRKPSPSFHARIRPAPPRFENNRSKNLARQQGSILHPTRLVFCIHSYAQVKEQHLQPSFHAMSFPRVLFFPRGRWRAPISPFSSMCAVQSFVGRLPAPTTCTYGVAILLSSFSKPSRPGTEQRWYKLICSGGSFNGHHAPIRQANQP